MRPRSNRDCFGRPEVNNRGLKPRLKCHSQPVIQDRQIRHICVASVPLRRLNFLGSFRIQEAAPAISSWKAILARQCRPISCVSSAPLVSPHPLSAHPGDYKNGSVIFTHPITERPSPIYGNRAAWSGAISPTPGVHHFQKLQNSRSNCDHFGSEQKLNFFAKSEAGRVKRHRKMGAVCEATSEHSRWRSKAALFFRPCLWSGTAPDRDGQQWRITA